MSMHGKFDRVFRSLENAFGSAFSISEGTRRSHAAAEGLHPPFLPDGVLTVRSNGDVVRGVEICASNSVPIIPFGAGSSVEGQILAPRGGIVFDLTEMNAVLALSTADLDVRVQAGLSRKQLNRHIRGQGLFFPVDPGADATLGGMASTRASGTTTVLYGGMRNNVLGATVVLPSGKLITTGGRARKSSAGYDLTSLLIGAEGTLGIITELQIKLHPIPEEIAAAVCSFDVLADAVRCVTAAVQSGVRLARIELLDDVQMKAVAAYSRTAYAPKPTLFLEFHGSPASVAEDVALFTMVGNDHAAGELQWATQTEDRERLWDARHKAYFAALSLAPGKVAITTDVCVPVSCLADCILETRRDIDSHGMIGPIVGHVGDGNFHSILLVDPSNAEELETARGIVDRMVERALRMGGTSTGEHGVGLGKRKFLELEHGAAVDVMRAIKSALDPLGIMNPGKMFMDKDLRPLELTVA